MKTCFEYIDADHLESHAARESLFKNRKNGLLPEMSYNEDTALVRIASRNDHS